MHTINSWDELDFDNHIFFNLVDEINCIIAPLVKYFSLDSFNYHRTYNDGSQIRLTNQPKWIKYYLQNKLYLNSIFELPANNYSKSIILSSHVDAHSEVLNAIKKFGLNHVAVFINPIDNGCEFYFFGTTVADKVVIDNCLSHLYLLEKFVEKFPVLAKEILKKVEPFRLITTEQKYGGLRSQVSEKIDEINFLAEISGFQFTKRELDCIMLLLQGKSAKQIGSDLHLSPRTVEIYINNLKVKTNQPSKNALISLLSSLFVNTHFS